MKLTISEILPTLKIVTPFTNKTRVGLLPIYSSIKLAGSSIEAYNGECGIQRKTTQDWSELNLCTPAGPLITLLERLTASYQEVELTTTTSAEGHRSLQLKAGSFSASLPSLPVTDYPDNGLTATPQASVELAADFLPALRAARFCAASDLAQKLLASVAVKGDKIYAAEAKRLYRSRAGANFPQATTVMTSEVADALVSIGETPTKLDILDGKLVFSTATSIIWGARFADDHKYPDIDPNIEALAQLAPAVEAVYDNQKFGLILQRLLTVNSDPVSVVQLTATPAGILLENKKEGNCSELLECSCKVTPEAIPMCCNGRLLADAVERFTEMKFTPKALVFKGQDTIHMVACVR